MVQHLTVGFFRSLEVLVNAILIGCSVWLSLLCYGLWLQQFYR